MNTILLLFWTLGMFNPPTGSIQLNITKLRSSEGYVLVTLYASESGFPTDPSRAFRRLKLPIQNNRSEGVFTDIPYGTYAIGILHDENDNGKMESNFLGIPKEGYGASNNAKGTLGPPKFSDAKFTVDASKITQQISVMY
jgi:uncharacterized protein (DUF2141 family)